ncbi:MAG TPA: HypC/HybG/HupF family hydrogenase formation chaperone [Chloroflexota bacterium]
MTGSESIFAGACTLEHDGCVVCSDSGIPVRVVSLEGDDAVCVDAAGMRATIAVEYVAPIAVGDVLLTHGGIAIGKVAEAVEEKAHEVCQ